MREGGRHLSVWAGGRRGENSQVLVMNEKFDTPKRRAFLAYCKKNLVKKKLKERDFENEPNTDREYYHYYVPYGTHGCFIIQIDIADFEYENKLFSLGFQYQKESCKLNCFRSGSHYNTSTPDEIHDFIPIFKKDKYIYNRVNGPQTRAYVSMSRKVNSLENLSDEEFAKKLFDELENAIKVIEEIKKEFKKIGCQFF